MTAREAKPATIAAYLSALAPSERAALEKLRRTIRRAAPGATECISYGMPAFRLNGRLLVAFRAAAKHCALHPMSAATVRRLESALAGWDTSPGTIRFTARTQLPAALVRTIVRARMAENERAAAARAGGAGRRRAKVNAAQTPAKKRARRARRTS